MRTRAIVTTLAAICIAGVGVTPARADSTPVADASAEQAQLDRVNRERTARGRAPLSWNRRMASIARDHSFDMAQSGDLHHNPRLAEQVGDYQALGENVGYGGDESGVHEAFMDSDSHRANILASKYTMVGIGVVDDGDLVWITQVFYTPRDKKDDGSGGSGGGTGGGAQTGDSGPEPEPSPTHSSEPSDAEARPRSPQRIRAVGTVRPLGRNRSTDPFAGMRTVAMLDRLVATDAFVPVPRSPTLTT